jgi:hypothetical protein
MKVALCIFGFFITLCTSIAQVIPENRTVNWSDVINNHHFIYPELQVNVKDFGAFGDGVANDQPAIQSAINSLNGRLGTIYFPSGVYLLTDPLNLSDSVLLKGNSADSSTLLFSFGQRVLNCINIQKGQTEDFTPIDGGFEKDSPWIQVANPSGFNVGQTIEIREENGSWNSVPISWADYSVGQITRVVDIIGDKLFLESPLRIDYLPELNPQVRPINPIENVGVECLKIKRADAPDEGAGANIFFSFASNCVVRGVESDSSVASHVNVNSCLNLVIEGCYFHDAFTFDGTGMRGYGVTFSMHSSECLVQNNIFKKLRHAMMVKTGSNGNVIAYNYSIEPFRSEQINDFSGDISAHGHFAYANLFEGNIVQNIIIDHYWGPSGPYNTFFRNRAELYGIVMTSSDLLMTNQQNFVGNEVTNTDLLYGFYFLTGADHFEFGNNVKGTIIPSGTTHLPDSSYYLHKKPAFWDNNPWPSIGVPTVPDSGTIPARERFILGKEITVCSTDSTTTKLPEHADEFPLRVWPNPLVSHLYVFTSGSGRYDFQLMTIQGQIVFEKSFNMEPFSTVRIDLPNSIYSGYYIAKFHHNKKQFITKVIISK